MTEDDDDVLAMASQDSGQATRVPEQGLSDLGKLVIELYDAQAELAQAEEHLKRKKAEVDALEQNRIPTLMTELGVESYTMVDGSKLTLKRDVAVSIKVENRERAIAWMIAHGHEGIIKTEVTVSFGKGEMDEAERLTRRIKKSVNFPVELSKTVHPQTLKAWVREMRAEDLPADDRVPEGPDGLFTTFDFYKVKVEKPNPKKTK